jgi:predicted metalloendopeptidase
MTGISLCPRLIHDIQHSTRLYRCGPEITQARRTTSQHAVVVLFRHVNGRWIARTEIPAYRARHSTFRILAEEG